MPVIYTSTYDLKLLGLNPQIRHLYIDSHESKGGEPALVKVRNLDSSLPLTLRNNYSDSGYLTSETEARDIVRIEDEFQQINQHLRMGTAVCIPTIPLNEELSRLKKYTPKVEQYLLKRLNLIKGAFPLQG
jgi:hypothetical protein|tara:strand:- start:378 stop:770 length:393 start_codon:yes stop_codon:yes gene_type:complete